MIEYVYLIPLFPLITFIIVIFFGKFLKEKSAIISIFMMILSSLLSTFVLFEVVQGRERIVNFIWMSLGIDLFFGWSVDPLSSMMLFVVSIISCLIHIYSVGYMHGDIRYSRFFAYLSLFTFAMLSLVLSNNLMQLYIFWELVGLCSYLLIGFWFEKPSAAKAAKKAFLVTRFGDIGFALGIFLLFSATGVLGFENLFEKVKDLKSGSVGGISGDLYLTISLILLFCGAVGKSAQFPLHIWLPDAMEGPTPVSALIHAATMVAAGVYMVARLFPLFSIVSFPLMVVAYTGFLTAFISATIALVATDIKKVLAYSTISQLGFMMIGLGVSSDISAGTFHLITHAFFKALLFLCAGSVIHAVHTQEIWQMGGLKKYTKITYWTFLIAALSISGIPPFSGFFSKDEILLSCYHSKNNFIFVGSLFCAFLTSFYMFRMFFIVFSGEIRQRNHHPHESPPVMTIPLIILAIFSAISGVFGSPFMHHWFQRFITKKEIFLHPSISIMSFSTILSGLAILLAWCIYDKKIISLSFVKNRPWNYIYLLLKNKYYIDEIYMFVLIRPFLKVSSCLANFDLKIIDGIVNLFGFITVKLSLLYNLFDIYIVDGLVNLIGWTTRKSGEIFKFLQTGILQNYILFLIIGVILFVYIFK